MRKPYSRPHTFKQYVCAHVFADNVAQFKESGDDWAWGCCPFHSDRNPSFCMNLATGSYRCLSGHCGTHGPNIVSFVCALFEFEKREALEYLENHYG